MNIDSFSLAALADELRLTVMGGRVQNIVQVTPLSFGFEIYNQGQRRYLFVSTEPQLARIHLQSQKPRRGVGNEAPLQQLFRKYLKNGFLMSIEQPGLERVILLHFTGKNGDTALILELLGNRTNLIFVDETQRILSLARPVQPKSGRHRVLQPNQPYQLPQQQAKLTAETLTPEVVRDIVERAPDDNLLSKTLVTRLAGLSPLIAREIVYRAYGDVTIRVADADDDQALFEAIEYAYTPLTTREWQPHVAFDKNEMVEYFAPIPLNHLPHAVPIESISKAIEAHFSEKVSGDDDGYEAARFPIYLAIKQGQKRLKRRLDRLEQDAAALKDPEVYKQKGEAIFSYSYQIQPGQTELEVPWLDEEPLEITLDPALSPSQNAQKYLARYQKAKRAADIIPKQRDSTALELEYLNQLALDLEMAETRPEIDAVAAAVREAGFRKDFKKKMDKSPQKKALPAADQPRRFTSPDGFTVWVGRNASQNHNLTFGIANPDDIWMHARGIPGAHVVIAAPDQRPPKSTVQWAASVAAYYSKARKAGRAIVSYTRKKYVRPIKGAPPGLVRIRNESTIRVAPEKPDED